MIASKVSAATLISAAYDIGVRVDVDSKSETRHRVKLYPDVPARAYTKSRRRRRGAAGDAPYQRESVGYGTAGRRVHAVCWHGFRDYFRAVYRREPNAVFRTSIATWRGSRDFEARFEATGLINIGPRIAPVAMIDACRCRDSGTLGQHALTDTEATEIIEEHTITPEMIAAAAGIDGERWADYNRKFNALIRGKETQ